MSDVNKICMQEEYENALQGGKNLNKKIIKLGKSNKIAYEDLIFSIDTDFSVGKVAFGLVKNAKSLDMGQANK